MEPRTLYSLPVLICGIVAILFAAWLARNVLSRDTGTPAMQDIANRIYIGAVAFLRRQYSTIALLSVVVAIIIGLVVGYFETEHQTTRGIITSLSFLFGAAALRHLRLHRACTWRSAQTSAPPQPRDEPGRSAHRRSPRRRGLWLPGRRAGLLGVLVVYWIVYPFAEGRVAGGSRNAVLDRRVRLRRSFVALFAQLGGGIYTKAADVGADLVGKVEAGIPEDDPRNPAVIADLVGDNVGDCAGRGADIFESSAAEMIGAMILGVDALHGRSREPESASAWLRLLPARPRRVWLDRSMVGIAVGSTTGTPDGSNGRTEQGLLRHRWPRRLSLVSRHSGCCRTVDSSI